MRYENNALKTEHKALQTLNSELHKQITKILKSSSAELQVDNFNLSEKIVLLQQPSSNIEQINTKQLNPMNQISPNLEQQASSLIDSKTQTESKINSESELQIQTASNFETIHKASNSESNALQKSTEEMKQLDGENVSFLQNLLFSCHQYIFFFSSKTRHVMDYISSTFLKRTTIV